MSHLRTSPWPFLQADQGLPILASSGLCSTAGNSCSTAGAQIRLALSGVGSNAWVQGVNLLMEHPSGIDEKVNDYPLMPLLYLGLDV